jgi:hypothetical protein
MLAEILQIETRRLRKKAYDAVYKEMCRAKIKASNKARYAAADKDVRRAADRRWRHENPDKVQKIRVRMAIRKLRLNPATIPTRPAVCDLCGRPPGKRALHLDHDHVTGEFRGWLCSRCNVGLGQFGDDPKLLQKAMMYLEGNTHAKPSPQAP